MSNLDARLQRILDLLRSNRPSEAYRWSSKLIQEHPESVSAWLLHSQIQQRLSDFPGMLLSSQKALHIQREFPDPDSEVSLNIQIRLCLALMLNGQTGDAVNRLNRLSLFAAKPERNQRANPRLWIQLGELYTQAKKYSEALSCYQKACTLQPDNAHLQYNLATAHIAMGNLTQAETTFDRVIELNPKDYDAYQNRSTLRTQTPRRNHLQELIRVFSQHPEGTIPLGYALAKEYEDLGEYAKAFGFLKRAADTRRRRLTYIVETDLKAFQLLRETFQASLFKPVREKNVPAPETLPAGATMEKPGTPRPVFIVGLPRSGTTLVERILSSHSNVDSLGEVNDFALTLMNDLGGGHSKQELIQLSAKTDFRALGQRYCSALNSYAREAPLIIDKTPLNYLYLGLIHLALPDARIIHVRRNAMDSCYAMYKTLFRMGYPFSYNQEDLARYYLGYLKLMAHWRQMLPNGFLDIDYEDLVENPATESRKLVNYCGLEWQPQCLRPHQNPAPSATASAAQIRQPVYTSSVNRWHCYRKELQPLVQRLTAGGIDVL